MLKLGIFRSISGRIKMVVIIENIDSDVNMQFRTSGHYTTKGYMMTANDYVSKSIQLLRTEKSDYMSIMSVGVGSGSYEKELSREFNQSIKYILAIEPDKNCENELRQTLESASVSFAIDNRKFNESYESDELFDLIIFHRSLLYMKNSKDAVENAIKLLRDGGKMIVFNHFYEGCSQTSRKKIWVRLFHK